MRNLLDMGFAELRLFLAELSEPAYRAEQIIQWVHQHGVLDFAAMSNLSKTLRSKLQEHVRCELPSIVLERTASDGTSKSLLRLSDGNVIEMVYIPEQGRGTLCISSQVGCALNCSFCSTGKEGFSRNLKLSEIIGQTWLAVHTLAATQITPVTNIVLMGMGEPLLNYEPVLAAIQVMLSDMAYGFSKYRVTLSTAGVVPAMQRLQQESPVSLAVSLHAANNTLRNELVPLNKKYPLEVLIPQCRSYFPSEGKRSVTFEYVMLAGVNDSIRDAKELIALLRGVRCKVNLIPFNPFDKTQYVRSSDAVIEAFRQCLCEAGMNAWTRKTRGGDIDGACGQLAGQIQDRTGRHERWLKTGKLIPGTIERCGV